MANSKEAQFQWGVIEAMTALGCKSGTTSGYCRRDEESINVSNLGLAHYRLTNREEKRLRLDEAEGDYGLTLVSEVGSGKPTALRSPTPRPTPLATTRSSRYR